MTTVGLISPGQMGAAVGAAAAGNGHRVIWAGEGRSPATTSRAGEAGLEDCGSLSQLVTSADCILSICPPHDAAAVSQQIINAGYTGLFADCNAISPAKTRQLASDYGGPFVDGGIVGGPPVRPEDGTTLYLSGTGSDEIAALFGGSPLATRVISNEIGQASALNPNVTKVLGATPLRSRNSSVFAAVLDFSSRHIWFNMLRSEKPARATENTTLARLALENFRRIRVKMVFAAFTKGSTALLTAILAVAETEGVRRVLEDQWGEDFTAQTHRRVTANSGKAWRFAGEMREIAATFESAGMPAGFHLAAAEVFEALSGFKDSPAADIEALFRACLAD